MSADRSGGSGVGGAVGQHRENDLLVLVGRLETVWQRRPLEIPLVVERLFPQPLHHPVDRHVPCRGELVVAPPPVVQRLEAYVGGRRGVMPAAAQFQRFERLALILFGLVVPELWFLGRGATIHSHRRRSCFGRLEFRVEPLSIRAILLPPNYRIIPRGSSS